MKKNKLWYNFDLWCPNGCGKRVGYDKYKTHKLICSKCKKSFTKKELKEWN